MCPVFDDASKKCKVTPWDSNAVRDANSIRQHCQGDYKKCGNYEAYKRGEYKIKR